MVGFRSVIHSTGRSNYREDYLYIYRLGDRFSGLGVTVSAVNGDRFSGRGVTVSAWITLAFRRLIHMGWRLENVGVTISAYI